MSLVSKAQPAGLARDIQVPAIAPSLVERPQPVLNLKGILLEKPVLPITLGSGRGIVIPGGGIYLRSAWVTIRMIREFGCELPIELWLLPWETVTDDEFYQLRLLDVKIRTATPGYCLDETIDGFAGLSLWLAGWQLKVQAVCQSAFREVIFLDADCYPVDERWVRALAQSGSAFVGDILESDHLLTETACQVVGVERGTPVDSGCFHVVKSAAWLQVVAAMNGPKYVRDTYRLFFGDKDTWWIAHELTDTPYQIIGRGNRIGEMEGIYHAVGVVHRTGVKLTTGQPRNTPQRLTFSGPCEALVEKMLRSWPPLHVRGERDWELVQSVLELDEYHLLERSKLGVVIDCGGHIGAFSVAVTRLFPAARILAFEPSEENAAIFRINCPQAELYCTALGNSDGENVELWAVAGDTAYSTADRIPGSEQTGESCAVSRLSGYLREIPAVDLMKIDIEGDEYPVFEDLSETGQIRKVLRIVGEWHNFDRLAEMLSVLRSTHHITICVHYWDHGYFEAIRNDQ